ncbi:MAG: glycosyltransferase family 39 protein [Deltaproteobacteria bacterium]|nr:glycosyltransferase family 39 protein [Deltaproteobacteria bacterium]
MPRFAKAALAAFAAAALALGATWVVDLTYLRYGADFTYAGYVPETPPPPAPPAAGATPSTTPSPPSPSTGTIVPPTVTHPGVVMLPDAGPSVPRHLDAGARRAFPSLAPVRPSDDGGVPRPFFRRPDGGTATRRPYLRGPDGGIAARPYLRGPDGGIAARPFHRAPDGGFARPAVRPASPPAPRVPVVARPNAPATPTPPAPPAVVVPRPSNPYLSTVVDRRVERTAQLFTVVRAQARVINAWDFLRLGPMLERPKVHVRIRARLNVDRTGLWRFEVRGGGRGVLTIDGVPLATAPQKPSVPIPLAAGTHDYDLAWRIEEASDRLVTYAAVGTGPFRSLNSRAFRPPPDAPDDYRTLGWILGIGATLLAAALAAWTFGARDRATTVRRGAFALGLAIVLAGTGLRTWDYDVVPQYGQIGDELFVTWNGWSMIAEGRTRGWSLWPEHYAPLVEVTRLRFVGTDWQAITPYFEHPPLMHLAVGAVAHLSGARHYLEARMTYTRLVPVLLSSLMVLLVMLLARRFDRRPAVVLMAGALGAFLPVLALQGRLLKEDHLLAVLLVGSLLAALEWLDRRRIGWLLLAATLAGLAPLAKIPGVASIAAVFCIAWAGGGLRTALGTLLVSLPIASLVIVHGAVFGWDSFVRQTLVQGTIRGGTWSIFVNWFEYARIGDNDVGRGWLLLLWFGFFTGFPKARLERVAYALPVFLHITATALASNWMYGWYLLPIYPFLCIGTARSLASAWTEADGWRPFVLTALGPMYALQLMPPMANVYVLKFVVTGVVLVLFTPLVVHTVMRTRVTASLVRAVIVVGLGALLVTSVAFIVTYDTTVLSAASFDAHLRR